AITVGAIGTLTLCVMSRTWMQRSGVHPNEFVGLKHVVGLVSLSAVLRLVSGTLLDDWAGLAQLLAAIAWSTAFAMVLVLVMIKYPGRKFSGR
ncbi:MAG: NnrS family protein, partial [Pseudomonadales bacterium]